MKGNITLFHIRELSVVIQSFNNELYEIMYDKCRDHWSWCGMTSSVFICFGLSGVQLKGASSKFQSD